jgi:Fe2+ or Zn2+ uptake regulation protein
MTNYLTPSEIEELRKDKQAITAQSDKLCEIFQEQREEEDQPDIESIYEALK